MNLQNWKKGLAGRKKKENWELHVNFLERASRFKNFVSLLQYNYFSIVASDWEGNNLVFLLGMNEWANLRIKYPRQNKDVIL